MLNVLPQCIQQIEQIRVTIQNAFKSGVNRSLTNMKMGEKIQSVVLTKFFSLQEEA